jgi:hypothetical protein
MFAKNQSDIGIVRRDIRVLSHYGFKGSLVFMSLGFSLYIWLFVLGQINLNNIKRQQPPSLFPSYKS